MRSTASEALRENEALRQKASAVRWFNAMDFGDFQAKGREKPDAKVFNSSLFGTFDLIQSLDLRGMRCIDVASASGLVALGMHALGADYVAAADALRHDAFDVAQEITGRKIDYRITGVEHLQDEKDWLHSFDLVVSSGLMYHLWSPFQLIYAARKLLKKNGIFILQSFVVRDEGGKAGMYLNSKRNINGDHSTYFVPSPLAMAGMLRGGCFDIIAQRTLKNLTFAAYMGRAVDPDQMRSRSPLLKHNHDHILAHPGYPYGGYDLHEFLESAPVSTIQVPAIEPAVEIDEDTYTCTFPYNPLALTNAVGPKFR